MVVNIRDKIPINNNPPALILITKLKFKQNDKLLAADVFQLPMS